MARETFCLFCFRISKPLQPGTNEGQKKNEDFNKDHQIRKLQQIFIHSLQRYLAEDNIKLQSLIYPNGKVEGVIEPCTDCSTILHTFSDLYRGIKVLEMKLKWRLETLVNIVRSSRKVKFRLKGVEEMLMTLVVGKEKDLDTGNFIEAVKDCREDFVNKCSSKLKSSYPKVELKKISEEIRSQVGGKQQDKELLIKTESTFTGNRSKRRRLEKRNVLPDTTDFESFPDSYSNSGAKVKAEQETKFNGEAILNDDLTDLQDLDINGANDDLIESESPCGGVSGNMVLSDGNNSGKRAVNGALKATHSHNTCEEIKLTSMAPEHEEMLAILNENCPMPVPISNDSENNGSNEALRNEIVTNIGEVEANNLLEPSICSIDSYVSTKEEVTDSATVGSGADELFRQIQDEIVSVEVTEVNQLKNQGAQHDGGSQLPPGTASFFDDVDVRGDNDLLQEGPSDQSQPTSHNQSEEPALYASCRRSSTRARYKCSTCTRTFTSTLTLNCHQETCSHSPKIPIEDQDNLETDNDNEVADGTDDDQWNEEAEDMEDNEVHSTYSPEQSDEELYEDPRIKIKFKVDDVKIDPAKKTFKCPMKTCRHVFVNLAHLKSHSRFHGQFKCSFCPVKKSYAPRIPIHELTHKRFHSSHGDDALKNSKDLYLCPHCNYMSAYKRPYIKHHINSHMLLSSNLINNNCNICQAVIKAGKEEMNEMMQIHFTKNHDLSSVDPNKVKRCNYSGCSAYFLKRNQLIVHKSNFHHDKSLSKIVDNFKSLIPRLQKCKIPKCKEIFYSKEDLETHSKLHGSFQCLYCPEVKTYAPDLSLHETEMHNSEKTPTPSISFIYTCVQCNLQICGRANYINHHLKLHLNLTPVTLPSCKICQFVFTPLRAGKWTIRPSVIEHYEAYHNTQGMDRDLIQHCDIDDCKAYFVTPGQLRRHVRDIHFQDWKPSYKCPDCSKLFRKGTILRAHRERQHSSNWAFKCTNEHCTRRFETEELLKAHGKCHEIDEKTRYCPVCRRTFKNNGQLKSHIRTHESYKTPKKAKEYLCAMCGKKSSDIAKHQRHLLGHSGPETWKYSCETCGKKCMTIQKLEEHLNTHRTKDKKVFTCEHCGLAYAHRHNFRHHLKNKHGVILENPRQKKTSSVE